MVTSLQTVIVPTHSVALRTIEPSPLTRELGNLRYDVTQLKSNIVSLKSTSNYETCLIYVRLKNLETDDVRESLLNAILHCPIVCYSIIRKVSLRVRIQKHHLHSALSSTDTRPDIVRLWRPILLPALLPPI